MTPWPGEYCTRGPQLVLAVEGLPAPPPYPCGILLLLAPVEVFKKLIAQQILFCSPTFTSHCSKAIDASVLTAPSVQPSQKQTKQGHFYPVDLKHYFKQTSLSHQWCPVSRTKNNCSDLIVALFKDSGLKVMKSYSNSIISSSLSLFALPFKCVMECPFIVIDQFKKSAFSRLQNEDSFLPWLTLSANISWAPWHTRHRCWCWASKISWEMPPEGNSATIWLSLTWNKLLIFSVLFSTSLPLSFLYFFIFHYLSFFFPFLYFFLLFYYHPMPCYFQKANLVFCFAHFFHSTSISQWLKDKAPLWPVQGHWAILGIWEDEEKCANYGMSE